jgi:AcrR family transcriptional regulator
VETIAKTAGMAKGTVYLYYRSKDDMLQQILTEDLAELKDDALRCVASAGDRRRASETSCTPSSRSSNAGATSLNTASSRMSPEVRKKAKQKLEARVRRADRGVASRTWRTSRRAARSALPTSTPQPARL